MINTNENNNKYIKYICNRCIDFSTSKFNDIKRHNLRKIVCDKKYEVMLLSNDQMFAMTLIPYYNGKHCVDITELNHLSDSTIICDNKLELFNEIDNIGKNKIRQCKYCNETFNLISDLKKHIIVKCFYNELSNRHNNNKSNNILINSNNNIINTDTNTNNIYKTTYNIDGNNTINNNNNYNNNNYSLYFNLPVPFNEEWDLSNISEDTKSAIIPSQYVFSKFLNEILKNDKNLNVVIDKNDNSGTSMVYIDHNRKYILMKDKDIFTKTMDKLYDQLFDIIDKNKNHIKMVKQMSKEFIQDKYNDYCDGEPIKCVIDDNIYKTYCNNYDRANIVNKNISNIKDMKIIFNVNKLNNDNVSNRKQYPDRKLRMETMKECKHEDYNFLYDSEGENKF